MLLDEVLANVNANENLARRARSGMAGIRRRFLAARRGGILRARTDDRARALCRGGRLRWVRRLVRIVEEMQVRAEFLRSATRKGATKLR